MKVYDHFEAARVPPPKPGDLYLVRFPGVGRGDAARAALRGALRTVLAGWYGEVARIEQAGPVPRLVGCPLNLSCSYDGEDGWAALGTFGKLGCDAVVVRDFPELLDVAHRYLGPEVAGRLAASRLRAETFAHAWAKHEATLKACGLALTEGLVVPRMTAHYHRQTQAVVAVVAE